MTTNLAPPTDGQHLHALRCALAYLAGRFHDRGEVPVEAIKILSDLRDPRKATDGFLGTHLGDDVLDILRGVQAAENEQQGH